MQHNDFVQSILKSKPITPSLRRGKLEGQSSSRVCSVKQEFEFELSDWKRFQINNENNQRLRSSAGSIHLLDAEEVVQNTETAKIQLGNSADENLQQRKYSIASSRLERENEQSLGQEHEPKCVSSQFFYSQVSINDKLILPQHKSMPNKILDAESQNKFTRNLSEEPQLRFTNSIGAKDKARRDIIQYIEEKKARKQVSERASLADHQEFQDIIETPTPITYTNSPTAKSKSKQDLLEYIRQKKTKPSIYKLNAEHHIPKIKDPTSNNRNKKEKIPMIQYTKGPESQKRTQEDIIQYIQERGLQKGSSSSGSVKEMPTLAYTKGSSLKSQYQKDIISYVEEKAHANRFKRDSLINKLNVEQKHSLTPQKYSSTKLSSSHESLRIMISRSLFEIPQLNHITLFENRGKTECRAHIPSIVTVDVDSIHLPSIKKNKSQSRSPQADPQTKQLFSKAFSQFKLQDTAKLPKITLSNQTSTHEAGLIEYDKKEGNVQRLKNIFNNTKSPKVKPSVQPSKRLPFVHRNQESSPNNQLIAPQAYAKTNFNKNLHLVESIEGNQSTNMYNERNYGPLHENKSSNIEDHPLKKNLIQNSFSNNKMYLHNRADSKHDFPRSSNSSPKKKHLVKPFLVNEDIILMNCYKYQKEDEILP